jgi:hypothetical protein
MIKLTVMYNLPPGANHEEFIKWRTTTHQKDNMSLVGIIKSDFYVVQRSWQRDQAPYRYLTEAYFPDMQTFERTFFDPQYQEKLAESLQMITEPLFLISEEVISEEAQSN